MMRHVGTIVEDANERFGVGIYFGQDREGEIFVQSIAPQGSAARARTVKEGDVLVKVDSKMTTGLSLSDLKSLVVGSQGSTVTLAFRRHTPNANFFYYDVELMRGGKMYLDLLQRNLELATEKDRLTRLLNETQAKVASLKAERDALRSNPLLDDPRVKDLQGQLLEHQSETDNLKLQRNAAQERSATLRRQVDTLQAKVDEQESAIRELSNLAKDRLSYVTEMERRRGEEKGLWRAVHEKLEGGLKEGEAAKREAQYSLVQALADLQHARQDCTLFQMRERNVRERMERGHGVLKQALQLNYDVGLDLATLLAESETTHSNLLAGLRRMDNRGPDTANLKASSQTRNPPVHAHIWPPTGVDPVERARVGDSSEVSA